MAETNAITRTEPQNVTTRRAEPDSRSAAWSYRPPTDIVETGEGYTLWVDVPGASSETIDLSVEDGVMSIQAHVPPRYPENVRFAHQEYGVGNYHRRFRLGDDIDQEGIRASCERGVLTVTMPKRAAARARRIEITSN